MESQVHTSLVSAENALANQSERHPDGWGVAYYVAGAPHLLRSVQTAVNDRMFQHVSGIVTSQTVLAHLRKATQGELTVIDTHPFQYGTWAFAHNGNIKNFPALRDTLILGGLLATWLLMTFALTADWGELQRYLHGQPCAGICTLSPEQRSAPCRPVDPTRLIFYRIPKTGSSTVFKLLFEQAAGKAFDVIEPSEWDEAVSQLDAMCPRT